MAEIKNHLSTAQHWDAERAPGYKNLGWVRAPGPLDKIVELACLKGGETIVDAGTGSQVVMDRMATALLELGGGQVIGFDISMQMLRDREGVLPKNADILLADSYNMPFRQDSVDVLTIRQVLHNLSDIEPVVAQGRNILKPGGRFIGVEYVAIDDEVLDFERKVFDLKEPGRNLWTGNQFRNLVAEGWPTDNKGAKPKSVWVDYHTLARYSVMDWMKNSGILLETQEQIFNLYRNAPGSIVEKMNITSDGSEIFTDRLFAYVVAVK